MIHPHDSDSPRPISIWWLAVPLVALVMVVAMLATARKPAPEGQNHPAVGRPAPRLDLIRLSGEPTLDAVDSIPEGRVTLIHFWGTWCGPCKMEYPQLAEVASRLQSNPGFEFLSISCEGDRDETFEGLSRKTYEYFRSEGLDGIALADPQGITRRSTAERLQRNAMFYPTSLVIDPGGTIAGVWEGYTPESVDEIASLLEHLLDRSAKT